MMLAAYAATGLAVAGIHAFAAPARHRDAPFPPRARWRVALRGRRAGGGAAADLRRHRARASWRAHAAGQARGARGAVRHRARRAAAHRRLARRRGAPRRASRSRSRAGCRCSRFTIRAPRCKGSERDSARLTGRRCASSTSRFQIMVGARHVDGARRRAGRSSCWRRRRRHRWRSRGLLRALAIVDAVRVHRDRGRMDGDRGRPPAVGRAGRAAHRRRGDADAGRRRADARCSRCSTSVSAAIVVAARSQIAACADDRTMSARRRPRSACPRSSPALIVLALTALRAHWAAPTSAAACGICSRAGRAASAQRALIAEAIGPIWEANHVWLILVVVAAVHRFPAAFARCSARCCTSRSR